MINKILITLITIFSISYSFADSCDSKDFSEISNQKNLMVKAWNDGNIQNVVSFYSDSFVYMSKNDILTNKKDIISHYVNSFSNSKSESLDLGQLQLDYIFCKNIDENHQLAILNYNLDMNGKIFKGDDLLMWEKTKNNGYKIIVDFPRG